MKVIKKFIPIVAIFMLSVLLLSGSLQPAEASPDWWFQMTQADLEAGVVLPENSEQKVEQQELTSPTILNSSVEPLKVQPGDTMKVEAEIKDEYGIESVKADMGGIETIELALVSGSRYQGIWQANWLVRDTESKNYVTTITATNVKGLSSSVDVRWSDPEWRTPTAVSSYSCQHWSSFYPATKTIDDSTSTYWREDSGFSDVDGPTYDWYITFDMGNAYSISKIRIYTWPGPSGTPCKVGVIKVCNDAACSGESNLLTSPCILSGGMKWYECSFTETTGRYIEVRGGIFYFGTCYDKHSSYSLKYFYEFDAYCTSLGNPPNTPTLNSPPDGATGVNLTPDLIFNYSDPDNDACTKFDLKVDDSPFFSWPEIDETDYSSGGPWSSGSAITYSVSSGLSAGTKYYWKVRVFDGTVWSNWSDGSWDFTTNHPPNAPTSLGPPSYVVLTAVGAAIIHPRSASPKATLMLAIPSNIPSR